MEYRRIVCVLDFRQASAARTDNMNASIMTTRVVEDLTEWRIFFSFFFPAQSSKLFENLLFLKALIQVNFPSFAYNALSMFINNSFEFCCLRNPKTRLENCVKKLQNPICRCLSSWRQYVSFYRPNNLKKLSLSNSRRARKRFLRETCNVFSLIPRRDSNYRKKIYVLSHLSGAKSVR